MATSDREKSKELELKQLREELSEKITEQLPNVGAIRELPLRNEKFEEKEITNTDDAKRVLEALLFTASKPMTTPELKRVVKGYGAVKIEELIRELASEYERDARSFRIHEVAGGFEISTEPKYAPWILKLELQKKARQATQSALETLAILAYKQPMARAEIEDLRGVDVSGVISTLLERNLIKVTGRKEVPGRPFLYGTTDKFLEHFGLKSLAELPDILEIKTLIENSIRKEDLLQKNKMVEAVPEQPQSEEAKSEVNTEGPR